jgi:hypothetical protein
MSVTGLGAVWFLARRSQAGSAEVGVPLKKIHFCSVYRAADQNRLRNVSIHDLNYTARVNTGPMLCLHLKGPHANNNDCTDSL